MEANESLAYIAGMMDGEGTISIAVYHRKAGTAHHSIFAKIVNTCKEAIDFIDILLPGNRFEVRSPKHRTVYTVTWFGEDAAGVIELLLPYLIIKMPVAEIVLDMWNRCLSGRERTSIILEADKILREKYVKQVRECNRRGID